MKMKSLLWVTGIVLLYVVFTLSSCAVQRDVAPATAEKPAEVKVKPVKDTGDVGLLDLEKNYLILVTKEGKLITADFNDKTKVQQLVPQPAKMGDINLGQAATVSYQKKGDKNVATSVEYIVKAKK
jgi:hypothetical protein